MREKVKDSSCKVVRGGGVGGDAGIKNPNTERQKERMSLKRDPNNCSYSTVFTCQPEQTTTRTHEVSIDLRFIDK